MWLLRGFLRVRGPQLHELILSPGTQLNPRTMRLLKQCTRLNHLGVSCSTQLWRLDGWTNVRT